MNILTKICVVILLVSSLVACVVFVNMATAHSNYKYNWEQEKLKNEQQAKNSRAKTLGADRATQELRKIKTQHVTDMAGLKGDNADLKMKLTEAKGEIASLKSDLDGERTFLSGLDVSQKKLVEMNGGLRKQLDAANADAHKKSTAAIKFETMYKKSEAEKEILERQVSVLQDRANRQKASLIALSEKVALFEKRHGSADVQAETDPMVPDQSVKGTITAVKDNLASINLGSNSGMKVGMKLIISRDADYVGMLKLEKVDVNEAAGILMDGNPMSPLKGDKVTTKLD